MRSNLNDTDLVTKWIPQENLGDINPQATLAYILAMTSTSASLDLRLAKELNAIFVSMNYRLGFYGNMNLPELRQGDRAGDSGNFALLDQIKALDWVQENISKFGGDDGNVTVMGHSAGCGSVWHLMRSPLASGKFHKSFCMSGIPNETSREDLDEAGSKLLSMLLINDGLIESENEFKNHLSSTTPEQRRKYLYEKTSLDIINAADGIKVNPPSVDGYVITSSKDGPLVNAVPTIVGTTDDEAALLFWGE